MKILVTTKEVKQDVTTLVIEKLPSLPLDTYNAGKQAGLTDTQLTNLNIQPNAVKLL